MRRSDSPCAETGDPGLVFVTGPNRGSATPLEGRTWMLLENSGGPSLTSESPPDDSARTLVLFHPAGGGYEIEAGADASVHVNGVRVKNAVLAASDIIEIESPPLLLRYSLVRSDQQSRVDMATLFRDCVQRTRHESRTRLEFLPRFAVNMASDVSRRTTRRFRIGMVAAFAAISVVVLALAVANISLYRQVKQDRSSLAQVSSWFERQQDEYISRRDLEQFREDIVTGLAVTSERLEQLETSAATTQRIIRQTSNAVIFLQGEYAYRDPESGRKLRYRLSPDGRPIVARDGTPLASLDGDGPIVTRQFTGTGFVINEEGTILTNRHVALPWENDDLLESFSQAPLEAVFERFRGYLPGNPEPFDVSTLTASDVADLAVLQCSNVTFGIPFIPISPTPPTPGDEVIVMGYPTGLRALIARTSAEFIESVRSEEPDFWQLAERLARQNYIRPLASRGIVGQVSDTVVAYDAETTRGGSGGPVLNTRGELVAVNNAILPEYGGSNLGVPVSRVTSLLVQAGVRTGEVAASR